MASVLNWYLTAAHKYLNLSLSCFWASEVNENQLRFSNATAVRVKTFRALKLLRLQPSEHRHDKWLLVLLGSLVYRENPLFFLEHSRNDKFIERCLHPCTWHQSWYLALKEGLNWAMPPPCAANLHFIYRTCLAPLVLRGDYVTTSEGCMRVHNSIFDCLLAAFPRYTWFSRMHTVTRRLGFIINIKRTPSAGSESN